MSALIPVALRAVALSFLVLSLPLAADSYDTPEDFEVSPIFDLVRPAGAGDARVVLRGADQIDYTFEFPAEQAIEITDDMLARSRMKNGLYSWNATFEPVLDDATRALLDRSRTDPSIQAPDVGVSGRSGSIRIVDGGFVVSVIDAGDSTNPPDTERGTRVVLTNADGIIRNSACVGFDCPDSPSFGSDTLRLQENNLRIHFEDSSALAGFPANDWRLVANDSDSGGANYFALEDSTAGRIPFLVEAGAQANAIYATGNLVGFGTNQPTTELHVVDGDTPTLRLGQDGSAGFATQAWDVAANETSFFIRDVTNGSTLPFRVRPTAPSNSLIIDTDGDVGVGILTPTAALQVRRAGTYAEEWLRIDVADDGDPLTEDRRMVLDNAGNLFVGGAITQLSSRYSKENLLAVAGDQVLAKLAELPLWTWNYLTSNDGDRHIGPVAEDFYRTFGFGESERSLSPSDVAGVALAASQALNRSLNEEIEQRDQRIDELEARLARLEAVLLAEETDADAER